jgi:CRP-like cAMP-binding protein
MTLTEGETLIEEGQPNTHLYLVLSGQLRVVLPKHRARFAEVGLGRLGPGECVGEYSFLDFSSTSATVRATSAAVVFKLGARELASVMAADTGLASAFYRNLSILLVARLREKDAELDLFQQFEDDAA